MWCLLAIAVAQDPVDDDEVIEVPSAPIELPRRGPERGSYEQLQALQNLLEAETAGRRASEGELEQLRAQLRKAAEEQRLLGPGAEAGEGRSGDASPLPMPRPKPTSAVPQAPAFRQGAKGRPQVGDVVGAPVGASPGVPGALVFPVPDAALGATKAHMLPAGSYVKARVLTGVEAGRELVPMTLQADYASIGPNGASVDLQGCMILAQVQGDLATDRVVGKAVTLSCVRDDGRLLHVEVEGYLVGEDSTLGLVGNLITRQGRVLAAATVANLAKGAGEAVAVANTTTSIVSSPLGATGEIQRNVDGSAAAFTVGASVAGAAEDIADWYLDYAQQLTPAIAVGSGRDVWVVLLSPVEFEGLR